MVGTQQTQVCSNNYNNCSIRLLSVIECFNRWLGLGLLPYCCRIYCYLYTYNFTVLFLLTHIVKFWHNYYGLSSYRPSNRVRRHQRSLHQPTKSDVRFRSILLPLHHTVVTHVIWNNWDITSITVLGIKNTYYTILFNKNVLT